MNFDLRISDEAFKYLVVHRGSLDHLKNDREKWEFAYRQGLRNSYETMKPFLPVFCKSILDVGAGLGGIDILLSRHYDGVPRVTLLDGEHDDPKLRLHKLTTGSRDAAARFHADNCQTKFDYISPGFLVPRAVDLVVSTGAWCFHFPPSEYLDFVVGCMVPGAILITDVRMDKPEWMIELTNRLVYSDTVYTKQKRVRRVFRYAA